MNIGLQDACDLGARLAAVLRGRADGVLLDGYEATRRPVAKRIVTLTDRMTRIMTLQGPIRQQLRNLAFEAIGHLPGVRHRIAMQLAELRD